MPIGDGAPPYPADGRLGGARPRPRGAADARGASTSPRPPRRARGARRRTRSGAPTRPRPPGETMAGRLVRIQRAGALRAAGLARDTRDRGRRARGLGDQRRPRARLRQARAGRASALREPLLRLLKPYSASPARVDEELLRAIHTLDTRRSRRSPPARRGWRTAGGASRWSARARRAARAAAAGGRELAEHPVAGVGEPATRATRRAGASPAGASAGTRPRRSTCWSGAEHGARAADDRRRSRPPTARWARCGGGRGRAARQGDDAAAASASWRCAKLAPGGAARGARRSTRTRRA